MKLKTYTMKNNSVTCVLIDDDQEEHQIFDLAVCSTFLPLECSFFSNWTEALLYLKSQDIEAPDFLFLDWHMPGCESIDYIMALQQVPCLAATRFVVYSGYISQQIINAADQYHFKYLKKAGSVSDTAADLRSLLLASSAGWQLTA